ncbi:MAG: helix-turn-helix domain-containing protein [Arthrobacter sp.]|jgi:AraC-like DNA-binding protein|nr:helix-turn-helix domain-containing protein [Arthrobacter sp.]
MVGPSGGASPAFSLSVASPEEWADAVSRAFVPLRVGAAPRAFSASLRQVQLGPRLSLTRVRSDASEVARTPRTLSEHPNDDVLLSWQRAGEGDVLQHGRRAAFHPGVLSVYDAASPYTLRFRGPIEQVVLQLPRRALRLGAKELTHVTARPLPPSPSLRGLVALLSTLPFASADQAEPNEPEPFGADTEPLADAVAGLLTGALRAASAPPELGDEQLLRMARGSLRAGLADPRSGPERTAAELNVSLRRLQRLFERAGESPAAYLRGQRLAHARSLLQGGSGVAAAARASGYLDADAFSRAFKREYGHTPASVRTAAAG